jgi:hypothetical protein
LNQNEELRTQLVEAKTCANRAQDFSPDEQLSMIKVPSMFFIRVGNLWINLAAIRTLSVVPATEFINRLIVTIRWHNDCDDDDESSYEEFEGESGEELLAQSKKAWDIILQRLSPINPA